MGAPSSPVAVAPATRGWDSWDSWHTRHLRFTLAFRGGAAALEPAIPSPGGLHRLPGLGLYFQARLLP